MTEASQIYHRNMSHVLNLAVVAEMSRPMPITILCAPLRDIEMEDVSPGSSSAGLSVPKTPPAPLVLSPASPQEGSKFLQTPVEILHRVLAYSDHLPALSSCAKTCKELRTFIYDNPDSALWRDLFLDRYDEPRQAGTLVEPREVDWKGEVQDRELVLRIFRDWDESKYDQLPDLVSRIIATVLQMYLDLPTDGEPMNVPYLESVLRFETFQHIYQTYAIRSIAKNPSAPVTRQSTRMNTRERREVLHPDLMRLHVLLAPDWDHENAAHRKMRGWLREIVYSGGNYGEWNDWGPFDKDGTGKVDWGMVDAIGSVMMANAKDVLAMGEDAWRLALEPLSYGLEAVRGWGFHGLQPPEMDKDEVWDWAGVNGEWCGSYAFLDYSDWIALNEPRLIILRRTTDPLDLSRYAEAIGDIMRLKLTIDQPTDQAQESLPEIKSDIPTSSLLPPIKFHGSSEQHTGIHALQGGGAPSNFVRGVVQLTADNPPQVRWTLVIRYGGEDRWRLECVQVGGRGSRRGFFGIWTDAQREEQSPCGPVWYWPTGASSE